MKQFSSITKIAFIAAALLLITILAPILLIIALPAGIGLMVYYAWFAPNHAFPKPWKNPLNK